MQDFRFLGFGSDHSEGDVLAEPLQNAGIIIASGMPIHLTKSKNSEGSIVRVQHQD